METEVLPLHTNIGNMPILQGILLFCSVYFVLHQASPAVIDNLHALKIRMGKVVKPATQTMEISQIW